MNRGAGVLLIGAAAAAAALGISGGSTEAITALAIGGAGLFGIDRLLYSERRLRVYAEGARSITCALAAFEAPRAGGEQELNTAVNDLSGTLSALAVAMESVARGNRDDFRYEHGVKALKYGDDVLARGRAAQTQFRAAGVRLWDTVEAIRVEVTKALLLDEPDISQLTATLNQSIRAQAGLIAGTALPQQAALSDERNRAAGDTKNLDLVHDKAYAVEVAAATVIAVLVDFDNPSPAQLAACSFSPGDAGTGLRLDPTSMTIDTSAEGSVGALVVTGGKPPYLAQWVGNSPGAQAPVDGVDHSQGTNRGVITIRPAKNASGGPFTLLVSDQASRPVSAQVSLGSGGGGAGGGGGGRGTTGTTRTVPVRDDTVKEIQTKLIALGCLPAKLPNGKESDDGIWGESTDGAVDALALARQMPAEEVSLLRDSNNRPQLNVIRQLVDAPGLGCPTAAPPVQPAVEQPPSAPPAEGADAAPPPEG